MQLQAIQSKIYEVRGQKVMLDFDLAELYEVETKVLNQAVKRNSNRFPERFMFRLEKEEWITIRSQIVTASNQKKRNINITPFAFTEHGVTMLASVLKSEKAIQMNIAIVEAFISLKEFTSSYKDIADKIEELEKKYNKKFTDIYQAIHYLLKKDKQEKEFKKRRRIGFNTDNSGE
jgi:hypothetical protein